MIASPTPRSAFFAGILVFAAAVSFLAAVQVITTARTSLELTVVALILVVVIDVALACSPIVLDLAAPGATTRCLTAFNSWLHVHGRTVSVWVLVVAGASSSVTGSMGSPSFDDIGTIGQAPEEGPGPQERRLVPLMSLPTRDSPLMSKVVAGSSATWTTRP